jgi:hypothetical protein
MHAFALQTQFSRLVENIMDVLKFAQGATQTQLNLDPSEAETITLTLPPGCKLQTPATGWWKQDDGKVEAKYTREEILTALEAAGWLEVGADQFSLQGLALYARLRIGEDMIATAADPAREFKLQRHWCQIYAELATVEPELIGGGRGAADWRQWAQEASQ